MMQLDYLSQPFFAEVGVKELTQLSPEVAPCVD